MHKLLATDLPQVIIPKNAMFMRHAEYDYEQKTIVNFSNVPQVLLGAIVFCGNADRHIQTAEFISKTIFKFFRMSSFERYF